jgi:hypothetical protein
VQKINLLLVEANIIEICEASTLKPINNIIMFNEREYPLFSDIFQFTHEQSNTVVCVHLIKDTSISHTSFQHRSKVMELACNVCLPTATHLLSNAQWN